MGRGASWRPLQFVLFVLLLSPAHGEELADLQARFGVITGDVGLLTQGAIEWIVPHEGLPIETGDHIRTGEDGRAEVIMNGNVVWWLEPETDFETEHMEVNRGTFNLSSGTLLGIVDSGRTAGTVQDWLINTPSASVTIQGTEFALEFSKAHGARLGVSAGIVEIEAAETAEGRQPPVRVMPAQEAIVARGHSIQISSKPSARMREWTDGWPEIRRSFRQIQNTWSPFTPTTRAEARKKFVSAPQKRSKPKPHIPVRKTHKPPPQNSY